MFWIDAITACLCYLASFSLLERVIRSEWASAHFKVPSWWGTANGILVLFRSITMFSLIFALAHVLGMTLNVVTFQTFIDRQYLTVGYLLYHNVLAKLYPEARITNTQIAVSIFCLLASYIYSFGCYSWFYGWTFMLGVPHVYITWAKFVDPKEDMPLTISLWMGRIELGGVILMLGYSILFMNLNPFLFFGGLSMIYFELI